MSPVRVLAHEDDLVLVTSRLAILKNFNGVLDNREHYSQVVPNTAGAARQVNDQS